MDIDLRLASLTQLQKYVSSAELVRGFDNESAVQKCLMLGEEMGELFKAVRLRSGMRTDPNSSTRDVADELADVLNFVFAIANRFEVDLGEAFAQKEQFNSGRVWQ